MVQKLISENYYCWWIANVGSGQCCNKYHV